jgi:uncharacterized protein YecE (DUF72 family)
MRGEAGGEPVRVGPAGWSYPDWQGRVYPRAGGARSASGLELLARHFGAVEVNTTYYRLPTPELALGWLRKSAANPAFRLTAKLWKGFTHERELRPSDVAAFRRGLAPLRDADRLGAILVQLPWSFKYDNCNRRYLMSLLRSFADLPRAVELRHRSWDRPEVLAGLAEEGVGFCNIDQPLFVGSLGPTAHVTAEVGYVRLHGRNRDDWFRPEAGRDERYHYLYTRDELRPWVDRIRTIADRARRVFVITNNHFRGNAVVNALELQHLLAGDRPCLPRQWLEAFPQLAELGPGTGPAQPSLFAG